MLIERRELGGFVSGETWIDAKQQHVVAIEADIFVLKFDETARKQSGAGEQDHRKSHLHHDHQRRQVKPQKPLLIRFFSFIAEDEICSAGLNRGNQSKQKSGDDRNAQR